MNVRRNSEEETQVMRQMSNLPYLGFRKNAQSIIHGKNLARCSKVSENWETIVHE